jgi:pyridoxamine 5'-phosphate oxidase
VLLCKAEKKIMKKELQDSRMDYQLAVLDIEHTKNDPVEQFKEWYTAYKAVAERDVNAMVLSTASLGGRPSSRVVLLKGIDQGGFEFYTNYQSAKGQELAVNPYVALNFFWPELERQVRIEGVAAKLSEAESTSYFKSRPIGSQIGALASPQSSVIESRKVLEDKVAALQALDPSQISKPDHWGGYRVMPSLFEFWQGRSSRLHDRIQYLLEGGHWIKQRLAP